jgi:hypothetical protein
MFTFYRSSNILFGFTTFKMTFRDRIVVREIEIRAPLCDFEALVREIDVRALVLQNHPKSFRFLGFLKII